MVAVGMDEDERLAEGARAGDYVIEAHIGAGAMGDVYRARHAVLGKRVAVKVLKRRLASSAEALERFQREARTIARIDHPNVVDVFAFGQLDDGRLWLAMSHVEGEPLGRRLRERGPLAPGELLAILRPVCAAVAAAHAQGVIHRDLKSDNIVIGQRVYVLDFGIARVLADAAGAGASALERLTAEGAWVGTPAYMAPEQWSGEEVGPRTDVYALGVVVHEMLTGRLPFRGATLTELMEQHFRAAPPPLSTPTGGLRVPLALEAVVAQALAKRPEERPASALELCARVEAALGASGEHAALGSGPGAAAAIPTRTMQGTPSLPSHPGRTRLLFFGGAVGAAVVALAVALLAGHRGEAPRSSPPLTGGGATISITSTPPGAEIFAGVELLGRTPLDWHPPGATAEGIKPNAVHLELRKPGYRDAHRALELTRELAVVVALEPIEAYEGVWRIPSGELRRFEFAGDFIEGYALAAVDDVHPRFLRRFEYVDQEGERLRFAASEPHVERAAPDEPSCRFPLATEYRFDLARDTLEQRRQRVAYELRGGRCVAPPGGQLTPEWTVWEACARLAHGDRATVAESSAGGGSVKPPPTTKGRRKPPGKKAAPPPDLGLVDKNVMDDKNAAFEAQVQRNQQENSVAQEAAPPPQAKSPPPQGKSKKGN